MAFFNNLCWKVWVYFSKKKLHTIDVFKESKIMVEKQIVHYHKTLRTNETEVFSNGFLSLCNFDGILWKMIILTTSIT